jgi:hypothetical protein
LQGAPDAQFRLKRGGPLPRLPRPHLGLNRNCRRLLLLHFVLGKLNLVLGIPLLHAQGQHLLGVDSCEGCGALVVGGAAVAHDIHSPLGLQRIATHFLQQLCSGNDS